jgi:hypothetical protein
MQFLDYRPNFKIRLHFGHKREGGTTKSIWICCGIGGGEEGIRLCSVWVELFEVGNRSYVMQ